MSMRAAIAIIFLFMLIFPGPAVAQGYGTITGTVTTGNSHAVPDALVTLYDMDGYFVYVPENPQFTSNGTGNNVGVYTFYDVSPGTYNVTASKGESWFFAIATVGQGTATANVVLPEYVVTPKDFEQPAVPEPERPYFTYVPAIIDRSATTASRQSTPVSLTAVSLMAFSAMYLRSKNPI